MTAPRHQFTSALQIPSYISTSRSTGPCRTKHSYTNVSITTPIAQEQKAASTAFLTELTLSRYGRQRYHDATTSLSVSPNISTNKTASKSCVRYNTALKRIILITPTKLHHQDIAYSKTTPPTDGIDRHHIINQVTLPERSSPRTIYSSNHPIKDYKDHNTLNHTIEKTLSEITSPSTMYSTTTSCMVTHNEVPHIILSAKPYCQKPAKKQKQIALPRIISPKTQSTKAWNQRI